MVNAGGRVRDLDWWGVQAHGLAVEIADRTADIAMVALQGPAAEMVLQPVCSVPLDRMRYYTATRAEVWAGGPDRAHRLHGRGRLRADAGEWPRGGLWEALLARREPVQPTPRGLGARDTTLLEAGMALYGHELTDAITPLEAGLGRVVKLDKGDFVGRDALRAQQVAGVSRQLVGLDILEAAIPREGYAVVSAGDTVGVVTSGSFGPSVERPIALAYVPPALAAKDTELAVLVRGRAVPARVRALPFWPHRTKRIPPASQR